MSDLPSLDDLLDWLRINPGCGKRDIARAFSIKGDGRTWLKETLRDLESSGQIIISNRKIRLPDALPPVTLLRILGPDADGDLFAEPASWQNSEPAPRILILLRKSDRPPGAGQRVLCKLRAVTDEDHDYEARIITNVADAPPRLIGLFRKGQRGGRIVPVDKKSSKEWTVPAELTMDAEDGELVEGEALPTPRRGLPKAQIVVRHGDPMAPGQVSLIAMTRHQIELTFPDDALREAAAAKPVTKTGGREDLRDLPLITIDPADARDHDDAICAMPDDDPKNSDGHVVWVAIADVAHYVRPGSALDRAAFDRGNSTYFPDRVAPMLPDTLSGDLCSLHEGVDRPCLAVRMVLDANGNKVAHRFTRGLMRSPASLSYEVVQAAMDDKSSMVSAAMREDVLRPLYAAYQATTKARDQRQPLDLDMPERQIELGDDGMVASIYYKERLDAHRLIEEFMIMANVAAAESLEAARSPLLYRVHEEPSTERVEALRKSLDGLDLSFPKGQVLMTRHFNQLLAAARGGDHAEAVSMSVLRTQSQAYYAPGNLGHFGLNLKRYAHFTSPIRRYADLVIHRALISALDLGPDGLTSDVAPRLTEITEHISKTERVSMEAERDTIDRYVAAFMQDKVGAEFEGRISGVWRAGLFVRLEDNGADGLIPISSIGSDYFHFDRDDNLMVGERTGRVFHTGMAVTVRLVEAAPVTGGLILELLSAEGATIQGRRSSNAKSRPKSGKRGKITGKRRAAAVNRRKKKR
ncbi:MAG: ribonuclease R [Pseudomonadota bacterium]